MTLLLIAGLYWFNFQWFYVLKGLLWIDSLVTLSLFTVGFSFKELHSFWDSDCSTSLGPSPKRYITHSLRLWCQKKTRDFFKYLNSPYVQSCSFSISQSGSRPRPSVAHKGSSSTQTVVLTASQWLSWDFFPPLWPCDWSAHSNHLCPTGISDNCPSSAAGFLITAKDAFNSVF